jgi:hypothetical protein
MARKQTAKQADKALDKAVEQAFYRHGDRIQFGIMDLGKISGETKAAVLAGGCINEAMKEAVAKYRKN